MWQNAECCDLSMSSEEAWSSLIARRRLMVYSMKSAYKKQATVTRDVLESNSN